MEKSKPQCNKPGIAARIRGLVLGITAATLVVATLSYSLLEHDDNRQVLVQHLQVLASVMASNIETAIAAQDHEAAIQLLSSLQTESDMRRAVIYRTDGSIFAESTWNRPSTSIDTEEISLVDARRNSAQEYHFHDDVLALVTPINAQGTIVAYLKLEIGLERLNQQMFTSLAEFGGIFILLMIVVMAITSRLQRHVAGPVKQLIRGMRAVADHKDYTLRVDTSSADRDVSELIDRFNAMLEQIEHHDRALSVYQSELESQVAERTADLAEAKELAEAGSRAKSEFLATMSHEIRTPMNGVLGMTELLLSSGLASRQQRLAETAFRSAERLLDVINNILDYSKVEAGRLELHDDAFELLPVFEDILELFAGQAHRKGIELVADLSPNLPLRVNGDAARLRQILINLLDNAIKFTERGEVLLRASTTKRGDGSIDLDVEISDTGPGIPAQQQGRIFEAFVQADSSTSRQFGGPGLGLAIAQHLANLMGGAITLESEPGEGAHFYVSITMQPVAYDDTGPADLHALSGARVLVVDDHVVNREILCNQMIAWGLREDFATDAAEALALMRKAANEDDPYRYCILDWQMPEMDGIALARAIQADPLIPSTGLIMLSSASDDGVAKQAHDAGIHCYLTKPARQHRLLTCLLDLHQSHSPENPSQPTMASEDAASNRYRLLLAEDNFVNQEVVLGMLETLGYRVDIADDGNTAVEMNEAHGYDLILMDCHMPKVDGFEATKRIRRLEMAHGRSQTPIVALTADVQEGIEQRCRASGMDDYVSKPVQQEDLAAKLREWLPEISVGTTESDEIAPTQFDIPEQLDRQIIEQLRDLGNRRGRDVLGRVANVFLEETPKLLDRLHEGVTAGDMDTVHQTAHSLKSASANLGATQLMRLCARIEAAAQADDEDQVTQGFSELQPVAIESLQAIEQLSNPTKPDGESNTANTRTPHDAKAKCILIVDDDAGFRLTTAEVLRSEGFNSHDAANGDQALRMVERHRPDLVLLDAVMDGMDGFETCSRLRSSPAGIDTPIIMVTGLEDAASVERAFYSGATSFTSKPVSYPVLVQQIRFTLRASRTESELRNHKTMLQTAQRVARLGYWRWDPESDLFEMSENLFELCGIEPIHFDGTLQSFLALVVEEDRLRVHDRLIAAKNEQILGSLDYRITGAGRDPIIVQQDLELIESTGGGHLLGTVQDVSRQRESEDQIRKMAYYDALTGLASRSHLMQHLEDTIKVARRRNRQFTVLFLDLDGFKDVNDTMGHDVGDFMLVSVARRLQGMIRDIDFVARLGGDEFCILLDDQQDDFDAAEVASRCLETISQPIDVGNQVWQPNVSIGLARFPDDGDTSSLLLKAADSAMYAAKQAGKHRYAFYRPEMTEETERRLAMEHAVRQAIENDEFELHYQPQVNLRDGRVVAVEALARWQHAEHGAVPPDVFIPTLERIGLINQLGNWAISRACIQAKAWLNAGLPELRVAVNISPVHFHDPSIIDAVEQALVESGLPPYLFEIEITETSVQFDTGAMVVLQQLQSLGIRISIDDFGTGYSSLGSLKHLPINTLKIDRVFITDMLDKSEDAVMLGTIIGLAHALDYTVIAEGVEESEQIEVLAGLHCDLAQGYYFAKPVVAEKIPAMLTNLSGFGRLADYPLDQDKRSAGGIDV